MTHLYSASYRVTRSDVPLPLQSGTYAQYPIRNNPSASRTLTYPERP